VAWRDRGHHGKVELGFGCERSLPAFVRLSRNAKLTIYKTLIRPVAMYGSESWNTTEEDLRALGVFERKLLRIILGPVMEAGEYRQRYNYELYQLYQEPDIVRMVRVNRMRWAGHVQRRHYPNDPTSDDPVYKAYDGDFRDGRRLRGRPKSSWEAAVEMDMSAFGVNGARQGKVQEETRRSYGSWRTEQLKKKKKITEHKVIILRKRRSIKGISCGP